ncbi:amino acid transporter protein [Klebsormidium nitens]|uniref:Amino acid transporter protein n=1 Tax=Klebsormidium nitens TaxID=105231 RepID=A0A1Y1HW56_KLENI|nr:amino acid transporter protein [Klebsormidium nitens]|eukprot:GAQ82403.1 amino acid transporter protein [Klebsormidium nitens]
MVDTSPPNGMAGGSNSAPDEESGSYTPPSSYPPGNSSEASAHEPVLETLHSPAKEAGPLLMRQGSQIDRSPSLALRMHKGHARTLILSGWQSGVFGSCCNMSSTILGTGILALPLTGVWLGLIPMISMLLILAVANAYSCRLLLLVGAFTRSYTFEDATERAMGPRTRSFLDVCIFTRSLIVLASILIFTSDFLFSLGNALVHWLGLGIILDKNLLIIVVTALVIYPLALMRSMNSLALFSCFKLVCLWLFAAVVVYLSVENMAAGKQGQYKVVASPSWHWLRALPIAAFSYHSHVNLFPIYAEVKAATLRKGSQMITSAYILCSILFILVATFGYLQFPESTYGNFLRNFDDVMGDFNGDIIHVLRASFLVVTVFTFPMQLFAARIALHALAWPHQEKMSAFQSFGITTLMTAGALLVSLVTDDVALVLGIGGSIFTSYISMILPAQIYLRVLNMRAQKDGGLLDPCDRWTDNVDLERLVNDEAETQVASAFEIAMRPEQIKYEMVKASVLLLTGLVVGVVGFGATLWFR